MNDQYRFNALITQIVGKRLTYTALTRKRGKTRRGLSGRGVGSGRFDLPLRTAFSGVRVGLLFVLCFAPFYLVVRNRQYAIHEVRERAVFG